MAGTAVGTRGRFVLLVLLIGQFMANVDTAIVNVAAPSIKAAFAATPAELELVVSGYLVAYAVLLTTSARLSVKFGYDRVFLAGVALFTVASLGCGTAGSMTVLIVARVVQGFGAALLVAQVLIGIQRSFTGTARARALGWYSIALSGASISGQVIGGALVTANVLGLGWRAIFLVNLPFGVGLLVAAPKSVPPQRSTTDRPIDVGGMLALSATVLLLIVPLIFGDDVGWNVWCVIGLVLVVPAGAVFVATERRAVRRGKDPVVNIDVARWPPAAWAVAANIAGGATYFAALFVVDLYLQRGLGVSALESGVTFLLWVCTFGVGGPIVSRVGKSTARRLAPAGYVVLAVGYAWTSLVAYRWGHNVVLLAVALGIAGFGLGLGFNALIRHLTDEAPEEWAPDVSAFINTSTEIAAALGVAVFGGIYLATASRPGPAVASTGLTLVAGLLAATALAATACGALATRRRSRNALTT